MFPVLSFAGSDVKIGQATCGENGKLRGCKAGDQSGGEVSISSWGHGKGAYNWKYVFRAKDPELAAQIARNMIDTANNNYIGYDQKSPDRNTFYDEAKKVGWNISKVKTNCETTCSSAVSVCLNAAGVNVPRTWYAELVYDDIMATGQFDVYTSSDYTASDVNLLPGDILVSGSHTAMVVESPNKLPVFVTYKSEDGVEKKIFDFGSVIYLNGNDGKMPEKIVLDKSIDLTGQEPEKRGHTFEYWTCYKQTFSAKYKSLYVSLPVQMEPRNFD